MMSMTYLQQKVDFKVLVQIYIKLTKKLLKVLLLQH